MKDESEKEIAHLEKSIYLALDYINYLNDEIDKLREPECSHPSDKYRQATVCECGKIIC